MGKFVNFALDKMDAWRPYMPSKSGDFRRTNLYKKEKPELRAIIEQSIALAKDKSITDQQAIMHSIMKETRNICGSYI